MEIYIVGLACLGMLLWVISFAINVSKTGFFMGLIITFIQLGALLWIVGYFLLQGWGKSVQRSRGGY
jgi:hypothetical protein